MSTDFYTRNRISLFGLANVSSPSRLLDNRSRDWLLRCAFHEMKDWRKWRGRPLSVWIAAMTGHGSGYSHQVCLELGWDPDMKIGPKAELPRESSNGEASR